MKNISDKRRIYRLVGWTFTGLLVLLLALEGWRYAIKPSQANRELVQQELSDAAQKFKDSQQQLLNRSEELANTLRPQLLKRSTASDLYRVLASYSDFWSISLYQSNRAIVWKGFALQNRDGDPYENTREPEILLRRQNNTIFWECHMPFSIQRDDQTIWYRLFTSYRIEQNNPLAIGDQSEFNLFRSDPSTNITYPLDLSLFNEPPEDFIQAHRLSDLSGDSVGVVYATTSQFDQKEAEWQKNTRFWRSVYFALCIGVIITLFFGTMNRFAWWQRMLIQLLFIGLGWLAFAYIDLFSYWSGVLTEATGSSWTPVFEHLSTTFTHAIFGLLAAIAIARKVVFFTPKLSVNSYLSTIGLAGLFGFINAVSIPIVFNWISEQAVFGSIPLLDLRIFPYWRTIFLYLVVGTGLLAAGILIITLNRILFRVTRQQLKLSATVLPITFFISLFIAQFFIHGQPVLNWIFFTSIFGFIITAGMALGYAQNIVWISSLSPLRKVVLGSIFIAAVSMPMFYQAYLNHLDAQLLQTAREYGQEEDAQARQLTEQLLVELEHEFNSITSDDIQNNRSSLQARFTEAIQNFLAPQGNIYSYDIQLVSNSEEPIADYSTNLNSPDWTNFYNIASLKSANELLQQITKSTIRPFVQQPDLINQQDYQTFYRGWIPVFGSSDYSPLAWILCSVYKERPQFNKPIRAVMASLTYEDWNNAFLMQKYDNGKLINTTQKGFTGYFPSYQELNEPELQRLENDSLAYYSNHTTEATYRILLKRASEERTIKVSTVVAEYRMILFSFFRFSFTLLVVGCLAAFIIQIVSRGAIPILGENKRFQDRILDSFLLATLLFLGFLIASSHYAIKQQNRDIVRQELFDKLQQLAQSIESNQSVFNLSRDPSLSLESLATPWNVDAILYDSRRVRETTTPQIFQQNLLPAALPYEIYNQLYVHQQREAYSNVHLAGQSLLIGYRSILNNQNTPVATIAIPTFLESPKYDQQLLETTSYLILTYLLVFGLFILGSVFISKSLTRPLTHIQRGLNQISGGDLDTTIPVTSRDEIGNLAKAYNQMVFKLKKLQKDLAEAEREAAWKEMAQQVAHEIKNPLTPMKLNVQHLERQLKTDKYEGKELKERIQKIAGNLIEQIQSLSNIASDFSKFSQPIREDFSTVDLGSLLASVAQLYQHDNKLDITLDIPADPVEVQGIADDLKRVFINMVKNAYEAMDKEGHISLILYEKQEHAFIEIEDDGDGIPEEDRSHIFVPSFSTKSGGTGLGLAICKKIIDAHKGSISFASVEGEGTTFVIKLPLA
ncbi:His Kinase A (phospho-acceptor) domain-containing protein [Fodinibius roseus]|uniref:Signal transduction histidine-protein kinase/phosphatase MprB n=1 Tax=Fodinibius roseus TaxID=1194090 RepID=A0A1M4WMG4_9BACT|nr:HAMP domain-containing histidine kinase [Fodinibius roseus]SHE82162.1 His Kinase A (phospho-acceptor) domain-containing protein [Fodinibius roseus]